MPNLRMLDLSGCESLTDAGFAILSELRSLEHVNLSGSTPSLIPEQFDINTDPGAIGIATSR